MELSWRKEIMVLLRNRGKKQPLGLHNASSSCYVNSVLQCLTYSPPLANYCMHRKHLSTCSKIQNGEECPMCLLEDRIVRSLSEAQVDSEMPQTITSNLKIFASYLSPNEQTDAQEFLDCVINACDESEKSNKSPNNDNKILNKMFQSVQKTIKRCIGCKNSSNSDEIVNYFPLPLSQRDGSFPEPQIVFNLKDSLLRYFSTEYLKPSGPCEKCKGIFPTCIVPSISTPPNVLLLTLQRIWVDTDNFYNSKKMSNVVCFPESLQLTEYVTSPNPGEQYVYSLYAIICHQGIRMSSGHYIAYVKDADNCWFRCNDEFVTPTTIQDVLRQQRNVYMLFYIRQTDSRMPLSVNSLVNANYRYEENSTNNANGGYEASSEPEIKGQDEGIMRGSELITSTFENSTKTADGSSVTIIPEEAISKPDCEPEIKGQDEGIMKCSELITSTGENSTKTADGSSATIIPEEAISKPDCEPEIKGQDEGIMKGFELITSTCENSTKTTDGSSATIIPGQSISKPDCEGQGKDIFEGSNLQKRKKISFSISPIPKNKKRSLSISPFSNSSASSTKRHK